MNYLVGFIIICIFVVVAINYPVMFVFMLGPAVIIWVLRWVNRQSGGYSKTARTTKRKPVRGTASKRGPAVNRHSAVKHSPKHTPAPPSSMRWIGLGSRIKIGQYQISDPLTYFVTGSTVPIEASCISYRLPIGLRANEPKGALGYWPKYSRMSPNQRANYLHWLASGRTSPLNDIGYVFVFFYGLERRVLVDRADVKPIATEVVRLLSRYQFSGSFNGYASKFLAYIAAKGGVDHLAENWFNALAEPFFRIGGEPMSLALAWLYVHRRPLPAKFAYLLALHDVRFPSSVVIKRLPEQLEQLFAKKYRKAFGDGLLLRCARRPLQLSYKTATPSFELSQYMAPVEMPDILDVSSQFNKLIAIWTASIEELRPLSRKLARGTDINTREAYNALPESLKTEIDHPDKPQWDAVIKRHILKDDLALLKVGDIAAISGQTPRTRLTAKQSRELAETANNVGYVLVPDFRTTRLAYKWKDDVGLFRPKGEPTQPADPSYMSAARMLELGVSIAAADGEITGDELEHIIHFLETQFSLGPDDMSRLEVYREILTLNPPSIRSVAEQLKDALSKDQLMMLCNFLVGVAAADGRVPKDEIKMLRSAYTALGVDEDHLFALLNEISTTSGTPVEIISVAPKKSGEPIPPRGEAKDEPIVVINHDKVRRLLDETNEVSRMLGEAMQDIIPESEPILSVSGSGIIAELAEQVHGPVVTDGNISPVPPGALENLDRRYHSILDLLIARDEWTRDEFDSFVRQHGLMPSGTVEVINSWSDEYLGDFLIDESDSLRINRDILGG